VSATLGSSQLKAGLLAGGIGLALVILYSLIYYRALGLVTIASLCVSGGLTWAMLVILGREMGFTLSLAGIAGFIVAVGITADSFVVFFERIKDEVHEGRSVRVAVPRAWVRARRTILSADTVSFLAAAILYYFAAGDVRGFAFTLGLSTILDLVVVFLFTHPMVSLLSRSRAFGSARFTGLNSVRVGGIAISDEAPPTRRSRPRRERRVAGAVEDAAAQSSSVAVLDEPPPDEPPSQEPPQERRRTTPEPGTAAERAAARRARMREEAERKGRNR
jgi:preprotein translocase subunit SecD